MQFKLLGPIVVVVVVAVVVVLLWVKAEPLYSHHNYILGWLGGNL